MCLCLHLQALVSMGGEEEECRAVLAVLVYHAVVLRFSGGSILKHHTGRHLFVLGDR